MINRQYLREHRGLSVPADHFLTDAVRRDLYRAYPEAFSEPPPAAESRLASDWGSWTWKPSGIVRNDRPLTWLAAVDELVTARDLPPSPVRHELESTTALTPYNLRSAYHECGHAVVDAALGLVVQ